MNQVSMEYAQDHSFDPYDLFREAHHRIANNLALISSLLAMQASHVARRKELIDPSEVSAILKEACARLATVGRLHRLLLAGENQELELGEYLCEVADHVVAATTSKDRIELVVEPGTDCTVSPELALKIAMIVDELIINAVKYAHPADVVRGRIEIGCRTQTDGTLEVWVADDGVGLPDGFDPAAHNGLGHRTMHAIAKQISARIDCVSSPLGLTVRLEVPLGEFKKPYAVTNAG